MQIEHRKIGPDYPPLVIAEIGINHEGSLETAKQMVDAAASSGAEIIKHQTHVVEDEMSPAAKNVIPGNADVSIYDIMERCALSEDEEIELKNYVESKGMIFLSTPFSRAAADRLKRMNVSAFKIGSGECNNYPLIEHIAQFGKPMIVSTGMNDISSIKKTVEILKKYNIDYALMHCTNIYPTKPEQIRLGAMTELMNAFPDIPVGLSDHSLNNNACLAATALGASILERHFTDSMYREGPDIICSMDPTSLKELIHSSKEIFKMRGGEKSALPEEQVTIDFAYATVVTINDIHEGEAFTQDNIWVKRPGTGAIAAEFYEKCLGQKAPRFIASGEHLKMTDVTI
ncbi:MAG: N-acetylneuraminate synthase family protein [Lachnospiraceae bacterium]|nr:N-acetylneuraminate synthase family protein [Lachnospiraceae bacterium]